MAEETAEYLYKVEVVDEQRYHTWMELGHKGGVAWCKHLDDLATVPEHCENW